MTTELISLGCSSDEQHGFDEIVTTSDSTVEDIPLDDINAVTEIDIPLEKEDWGCSCMKSSTMMFLMFSLFTSIAITVGVLTVCFTSPKPSTECHMTFRKSLKSSIIYGSQPRSGAIADLNNDKKMDIIVINSGKNTVGIFLADGNGSFTSQQIYATGLESHPISVVINDFNNDNYLDIAVANYGTHTIGIFFGYGNGTFDSQKVFSIGPSRPSFIVTDDFNKDNRSDLAIVHYGTDSIGILLGNGDGSFQVETSYSTGYDSIPYSLAIGDFNNDHQPDIAVANYGTYNIGIFFGNGSGIFASQITYTTTLKSKPSSIAVGNFNDDGKQDIVVANYGAGNIGIFLNCGNGTFTEQTTYFISSSAGPRSVTVGYFNMDSYMDVVVVDSEHNHVYVLLGYGNGSIATPATYDLITGSSPFLIAAADIVNKNQTDIIIANYDNNNVLVLSEYSDRPASRQTVYLVGRNSLPYVVVIYDIDNDGTLDIITNNYNNGYLLILNNLGNGTFVRGKTYPTGDKSNPQSLCVGHLNTDNRIDIVVANSGTSCVGVFLGQDNGTFSVMTTYPIGIGSMPVCVVLRDLNKDNRSDIITVNYGSKTVGVLMGKGDGTFGNVTTYSTGIGSLPYMTDVGDVNNDNNIDIVVSNSAPNLVGVFLGYGNGTFGTITTYSTGSLSICVQILLVDLNRDNNLDMVVTVPLTGNVIGLFGNGDGSFGRLRLYSAQPGTLPFCATVFDFNGDSYYDMLVSNYGTNELLLFFGDGTGNLELGRAFPTGADTSPFGVAAADLDKDTYLEFIVAYRSSGNIAILTEYYAAEFASQTTYSTGYVQQPKSTAIGDFNHDNRSDIIVVNSGTDNLSIRLGLNYGTFSAPIIYSLATNSNPQYVLTDDVNKDGHLDIITINSNSNTVNIIMGYGNGTFADQLIYSTGTSSHPYAATIGDLNNDQRHDYVLANQGSDSIGIFLGFDYVAFQNPILYPIANILNPYAIILVDFNNDNYLDVAVACINSNNLVILLGHGDGSFTPIATYFIGNRFNPTMLVARDMNNDNQMDIVVANAGGDNIGVFLGYGDGSFATMFSYATGNGSNPRVLAFADFNNDNQTDMVTGNAPQNTIGILLGDRNGSFVLSQTFFTGDASRPQSVAVDDFNNDGQLDIAVANARTSNIGIFLGYGNGSFQIQMTYSTGNQANPIWLAIGDFNMDRRSDIAVANYFTNTIGIFLGYGNGSFTTMTQYSSGDGSTPVFLTIVDFNNDMILDVVIANFAGSNILILFGLGDGTFLSGRPYSTGVRSSPQSLAFGYINNDTQLDIVVANYQSNTVGVLLGNGREDIGGVIRYPTGDGSQPHSVAIGDLNNDSWSDIVVANYGTDSLGIFLGRGNGKFDAMITYRTGAGSAPYFVTVDDFDNDNKSDIVVTNSETNNIAVLCGYINGTFARVTQYSTGARSRPYTVAIGDFNNDHRSDLVIANSGTNIIFLLYGYGNGTFGNATSYALGYGFQPQSVAVGDLNQDNWLDIAIACYGTNDIETLVQMC